MILRHFKKPYLPIAWYLFLFIALALIPVGIVAYFSIKQADAIQQQAETQVMQRAHSDLLREMRRMEEELTGITGRLATWDETLALFADATYYNYWKETRVREMAAYSGLVDAVDLYTAGGQALTPDVKLSPTVYSGAVEKPGLIKEDEAVYIVYFHPIKAAQAPNQLLGYVGARMNIDVVLRKFDIQGHAAIEHITWGLTDSTVTSLVDAASAAQLQVTPSPEIKAFSRLIRTGFLEYIGYSFGLLVLLTMVFIYSLARPLVRLAKYLRAVYSGNVNIIPEDFHGLVNILELENVRQALNDYKDRIVSAAVTLEEKNNELLHLTYHDSLTGRYNRRAFESRLVHTMQLGLSEGQEHVLCYIDIDQFKLVNDTCGHVAGDELLRQIAALLEGEIRSSDMLARLGGDEFGVLFEGCKLDRAVKIAEAMRLKVKKYRFVWQQAPFDISISLGLASITVDQADMTAALKNADAACGIAKELGRNRLQIYQQHDTKLAQRQGEMQWVARIQQALKENRFELHGQLIRPTTNLALLPHYEVLIRLRDPSGRLISPMTFIPAAERYNLMANIDQWVVGRALELLAAQHHGGQGDKISLAINLSGQSLGNAEILTYIKQGMEKYRISPQNLCFEITETAAITNVAAAVEFIHNLRELGCKFALDDFGSGLSSFGYLSNFGVDHIKIDGHFITNIVTDPINRSIVAAINDIGHVMGIGTIAEFVENDVIIAELKKIGIDYIQGYGVHKPESLEALLTGASVTPSNVSDPGIIKVVR